MSVIVIQDQIVHYEILGRGRPLIFLHGWVGSWRYWIPSMQAASVSFRTYAVDLWGFGDTAK
ncbi:MAG TPA: alpha/beta fold hydrolase, partial [Anaerolineales bacterium]